MKQGTKSILFGSHSTIHSILVWRAWCILYHEQPEVWQVACIFLHDIGHIGKNYSDNINEKHQHWILGANIARKLFGQKGFDLIAGHDGYNNMPKSKLYKADKYSWYISPYWWLWLNNIIEPYIRFGMGNREAIIEFQAWVKKNVESGEYRPTHDCHTERSHRKTV